MHDLRLTDAERIEEIGRILALGAMRLLQENPGNSSKKGVAAGARPRLMVRDGERFAEENSLPDDPERNVLP